MEAFVISEVRQKAEDYKRKVEEYTNSAAVDSAKRESWLKLAEFYKDLESDALKKAEALEKKLEELQAADLASRAKHGLSANEAK